MEEPLPRRCSRVEARETAREAAKECENIAERRTREIRGRERNVGVRGNPLSLSLFLSFSPLLSLSLSSSLSLFLSREREAARKSASRVCVYAREVGGGANKREPCFVSFGSGFTSAFARHETRKGGEDEVYVVEEREENERRDGPRRNRPTVPCYYLRSCGESAFQDPFLPSFLPDALLPSLLRIFYVLPLYRFSRVASSSVFFQFHRQRPTPLCISISCLSDVLSFPSSSFPIGKPFVSFPPPHQWKLLNFETGIRISVAEN